MGIYYTNQTIKAYEKFKESGCLTGEEKYVYHEYLTAYKWMVEQMNSRIQQNGLYPIWLWTEKPDLQDEGHFPKGTEAVCLTVEVPNKEVLLSEFEGWHFVLNDWFLPLTEAEDELFKQGQLNMTNENSWERIFDPELLSKSEIWEDGEVVLQGVTPILKLAQVKKVEHFIAK